MVNAGKYARLHGSYAEACFEAVGHVKGRKCEPQTCRNQPVEDGKIIKWHHKYYRIFKGRW